VRVSGSLLVLVLLLLVVVVVVQWIARVSRVNSSASV
jgi:hypothetical protein